MNRNRISILVLSVLLVVLVGGRFVISIKNIEQESIVDVPITEVENEGENTNESVIDFQSTNNIYDMEILGANKTSDNPWGITAGEFDMEDVGRCVLLTPGTSMSFRIKKENSDNLKLSWMIHPWVSEKSDGVGIEVEVYESGAETPVISKGFLTAVTDDFVNESIDISALESDEIKIVLKCNSGENDNEDADWLVVHAIECAFSEE